MHLFRNHRQNGQFRLAPPENFSLFYDGAHLKVFRYVMVLCGGNQSEAEDITAEAFLRAWDKRNSFTGSPSARLGWVITIARNILIDQRRSENSHPDDAELDENLSDPGIRIEDILVDDEQILQVLDVMQHLPIRQRDILTLRCLLGWRVKDIADHLGLPENTVSVDYRRALARLQSRLASLETSAGRTIQNEP